MGNVPAPIAIDEIKSAKLMAKTNLCRTVESPTDDLSIINMMRREPNAERPPDNPTTTGASAVVKNDSGNVLSSLRAMHMGSLLS
jgi:hypothetical protein